MRSSLRSLAIAGLCLGLAARVIAQDSPGHAAAEDAAVAGSVKYTNGDFDGAIADFDRAIAFDAKFAAAWFNRGLAKKDKGDFAGAVADYSQAIGLDPDNTSYLVMLGKAKLASGDAQGAADDDTKVFKLKPAEYRAFIGRGDAETILGQWKEAVADYRKACEITDSQDYPRLMLWYAHTQQGEAKAANSELLDYLDKRPKAVTTDWYESAGQYLLDKISEAELVNAAAADRDPKVAAKPVCKSWFCMGLKALAAGDKTTAAGYFQKALATNQRPLDEYLMSQAELKALENDGTPETGSPKPEIK